MAYAAKRLGQGQLSATLTTTLATVTALKTWIIKEIRLVNTDSSSRSVTMRMPGSSAGAEVFFGFVIGAGESVLWEGHEVLAAGETITGGADVASKVSYTIDGSEG